MSEEKNNNTNNTNNNTNSKSNSGCLIGLIIVGAIIFFIVKGIIGIFTNVSDSTGLSLAKQYIEDKNLSSYYTIFDNTYVIGNIKSFDKSYIIEKNGKKYIFNVIITYNPKLNSGSTDITKENQATTYVVYNSETREYCCYSTLEMAKKSDIWLK